MSEKQKEELSLNKLKEKLKYYKQVVIDSSDAIIIQDFKGIIKAWNKSAERIYGFSAMEMIGKNIIKIIDKRHRKEAIKNIYAIKKGKPTFIIKQIRRTKDNRIVNVNIVYSPIYEEEEIVEIGTTEEDVSELKRESEKLKVITENVSEAIFSKDKNRKYTFVNPAASRLIGLPPEKIIGKTAEQLFSKEDAKIIKKVDDLNFRGRKADSIELTHFNKKERFLHTSQNPTKEDGKINGIVGVVEDVSIERKIKEQLKESEEKYRSFVENHRGISYKAYIKGKPILFDGNVFNITGYSKEDFLKEKIKWQKLILKEDFEIIYNSWKKLANESNVYLEREYRIKTKCGKILWIQDLIRNLKDKSGKIAFVQGELYDITEKKKVEEELILEREKANSYLKVAGVIILVLNVKGKIILMNKKGNDVFGYKNGDLIGKDWFTNCLPKKNLIEVKKVFSKLMKGEIKLTEHYENLIRTKSGDERLINWYNVLIKDEKGNIAGVLSSGEDITEKKKVEKELQNAYLELKKVDDLKSNAIRDASHELKSPLAKIQMFSKLLEEEVNKSYLDKEKVISYSNIISKNTELSLFEISGVLELSKLNALESIDREKVDFCLLVKSILDKIKKTIENKSLKLICFIENGFKIKGNSVLLNKMINNLISNAIKFTKKGSIKINCYKQNNFAILSIKDTGKGIKKEDQDKIFTPFVKLDPSTPGSGIGLAMVKKIVELHKGKIKLKSEFEKGSNFIIYLPLDK